MVRLDPLNVTVKIKGMDPALFRTLTRWDPKELCIADLQGHYGEPTPQDD